jgi:CRP-like cAMP-binding protein/NAD-dependent dihydropyrimidine dehydrogenase PreA subunit
MTHLVREDDDEGLFSRDINGQLVRLDAPVERDYSRNITLQIDGQSVTVPMAEPMQDANGNIILDLNGRTTPRYTTIYDAATKLYVHKPGDEVKIPIPVLCHQPHMKPVAVCRLCVVQIYGQKRGKRAAERKLLPACQHQVKEGMEVFTMQDPGADGDRVRNAVKSLTELLAVDSLKPAPRADLEKELAPFNELARLAERCGADPKKLKHEAFSSTLPEVAARKQRLDTSSPVFVTDHSACVLCDRCVRACNEVKGNNIIGRTGKGGQAAIGFDLDQPMGESDCVQCGECMISCPTSAITFNPVASVKAVPRQGTVEKIHASELLKDPLFAGIPPKFLLWQEGLVLRRRVKAGSMLVRQGEPGNTAFILRSGRYLTTVYKPEAPAAKGVLNAWMAKSRKEVIFEIEVTPEDVIVGEMSCLSGSPRSADLKVLEDGEVWEIRRNVLDRLMRLPSQRQKFETAYRDRSLNLVLQSSGIFQGIPKEEYSRIIEYMRTRISFLRINPGQVLFQQGDPADCLYIVRLGYTRIGIRRY